MTPRRWLIAGLVLVVIVVGVIGALSSHAPNTTPSVRPSRTVRVAPSPTELAEHACDSLLDAAMSTSPEPTVAALERWATPGLATSLADAATRSRPAVAGPAVRAQAEVVGIKTVAAGYQVGALVGVEVGAGKSAPTGLTAWTCSVSDELVTSLSAQGGGPT